MLNEFHRISINGRYIYCYLCLNNAIVAKNLEDIPEFLDTILKTFPASSRLDDWQSEADEVMPSRLFEPQIDKTHYNAISQEQILTLKEYYQKNELAAILVETLLWLGISNLYGGFNSNITFKELESVIETMNDNKITLPDFSIVSSLSVDENSGWGNRVNMNDFLIQ